MEIAEPQSIKSLGHPRALPGGRQRGHGPRIESQLFPVDCVFFIPAERCSRIPTDFIPVSSRRYAENAENVGGGQRDVGLIDLMKPA